MIPTARRLEFAAGFIDLGMLGEASDELEAIEGKDRLSPDVMSVRCDLYMAAMQWDLLLAVARELTRSRPDQAKGWLQTAWALRKLDRAGEAQVLLREAESLHAGSAVLHYRFACCASLQSDFREARRQLAIACRLDPQCRQAALDDPDLAGMWDAEVRD
jgi:predicted Zn-dependent protease